MPDCRDMLPLCVTCNHPEREHLFLTGLRCCHPDCKCYMYRREMLQQLDLFDREHISLVSVPMDHVFEDEDSGGYHQ